MRLFNYKTDGSVGLGIDLDGELRGMLDVEEGYYGQVEDLIVAGPDALAAAEAVLRFAPPLDPASIRYLPPVMRPEKILCVGLNYSTHGAEVGLGGEDYPTFFARFASGLVGHDEPMIRPSLSDMFDYEGELVVVVGKSGRQIQKESVGEYIAGYSVFNEGSVRDFQTRTSQWTIGKNFDGTGGFGPYFVTAEEVPPMGRGLKIETRLNGEVVQAANTDDLIFDIPELIVTLSAAMTLKAGDLIVTGTPSGVGVARKPPLFMKSGDVCEVEVAGVGLLRNPIRDEHE